jgi:hypothetical protein
MSSVNAAPPALALARAPFRIPADADPAQVAREMEACFRALQSLPRRMTTVYQASCAAAGLDASGPLASAGLRIAGDIDSGIGDGDGNPYHNVQHFCEMVLSTLCLSRLVPCEPAEKSLLLFAALMHDFHHDGRIVKGVPFRLERLAIASTQPYLDSAGVPADERERLAALILATFVPAGVPFARHCHRHHFLGAPRPEPPADAGALALLAEHARLAMLAVMLTEADVLASVGLTVALGDEAQRKIEREMGVAMGPADKLFFLETVFGRFEVGTFFAPNLEAMKDEMRARVRQERLQERAKP